MDEMRATFEVIFGEFEVLITPLIIYGSEKPQHRQSNINHVNFLNLLKSESHKLE